MGKINRAWKFLVIIVGVVIVGLVVWFMVGLVFDLNRNKQVSTGVDLLSEVDITGKVKMVDESKIVLVEEGGTTDREILIDENTKYELRNPRNFAYEEASKDIVTKDKTVYVEVEGVNGNMLAKRVKTDYQTILGGKVKSIEGGRIVYVDYLGQEIFTDMYDGTKIFQLGRDDLLTAGDIPLENNIVVYSKEVYQLGQPFMAEWIDVLDDGLLTQDLGEVVTTEGN